MRGKKATDFVPEVAKQEGIPEEHLRIMVDRFYHDRTCLPLFLNALLVSLPVLLPQEQNL